MKYQVNAVMAAILMAMTMSVLAMPVLNVDGGGQLLGVSGVDVGGTLFDVEFVDGSCSAVFSGCDESGDFVFNTSAEGQAASLALLAVIEGSVFDERPELTLGCESTSRCDMLTPYRLEPLLSGGLGFVSYVASNRAAGGTLIDGAFVDSSQDPNLDFGANAERVFARWERPPTQVSEPSTFLLLGLGLGGIAACRRRKSRVV